MVLDISLPGFLEDLLRYTLYSSFLFYNQYRIFYMCNQINSSSSSYRILYKVLVLTFQAVHNLAPMYITDLISVYEPGRQLRSASRSLLTVPRHNLERFGRRGFSLNAPHLWNDLSDNLRLIDSVVLFKQHLKTHLFKAAFSVYL